MQLAIKEVNSRNRRDNLPEIAIGIGLNTGDVVAGNIGSELRSKYGVVGHNVNLTGRIESCTVGGQILASPATVAAASLEVLTGKSVAVDLKGMAEPLALAEILGVGLPYDLLLDSVQTQWQNVAPPVELRLSLMSDKQVASTQLAGLLVAVAGCRFW